MRLTPEQVRERFEREVKPDVCHCDQHGSRHVVHVEMAIAFAQLVARGLQAPPTGEEVERAAKVSDEAIRLVRNAGYDEGVEANCEMPEPGARERTKDNSDAEEASAIAAVRAYGAACHAAGRAESGNREPTDATESEAFCALKNRLTDLLNSHGHYREMTAYQGALERYREAVASAARAEAGKAANVLKRLCEFIDGTVDPMSDALATVQTVRGGVDVHLSSARRGSARVIREKTFDAIAAALDQLAAETGRR